MVAEVLLRQRASRPRRTALWLAALLVVLMSMMFTGLTAESATAAAPAQAGGVTLSVAADNEGILAAGEALNVSVTIENTGSTPLAAGTAELGMDPSSLQSRTALDSWLSQSGVPSGMTSIGSAPTDVIEPGIPYTYRITVPAASLPFVGSAYSASFGIAVSLTSGAATIATSESVVVWNAGGASNPTRVAVAVPLTVPPSVNGIISAADLATYTAPGGVLTRELDAVVANPSVAVGIDPMIIASIRALNNSAPPSALDWLKELSAIVNPTFALQYGDADPAGQVQAGATTLLQPGNLSFAMNPADFRTPPTPIGEPPSGSATVTPTPTPTAGAGNPNLLTTKELLAWPYTFSGVAWPSDDTVRSSDIAAFAANGLRTTILSTTNTNASTLSSTPNAAVKVGSNTALAADAGLSAAVRQAATSANPTQLNAAMADANSQLQLISGQSSASRTILVTLDRETPTVNGQLAHVLSSVAGSPWSTPASLQDALNATPTSGLAIKDAPESASRISSIQFLLKREAAVDQFATVLDTPQTLIGQTRAQLLTTLGVGWESPKQDWDQAETSFLKSTSTTLASVSILATDNVNLVGTQGSIPFTVSNELPDEAVTVVLSAVPSNGRLEISGDTTKRVEADSRTTVLVPVKAELGNGKVTLQLQLYSKTGVPIGAATTVPVEVHADWEGIGALIVGILLVLLFGFGIVRNILRRRRGNGDDDEGGSESVDDDPRSDEVDAGSGDTGDRARTRLGEGSTEAENASDASASDASASDASKGHAEDDEESRG